MDYTSQVKNLEMEVELFELGEITLQDNSKVFFKIISEKEYNEIIQLEKDILGVD